MTELSVIAGKEAAPSFMERVLAFHTVTHAAEDMIGTVVESEFGDTEHKSPSPSKTVIRSSPDTRSETKHVLTDPAVVTKDDVRAIVESTLTRCTITLQSQVLKAIQSTFDGTIKAIYFN